MEVAIQARFVCNAGRQKPWRRKLESSLVCDLSYNAPLPQLNRV
jgi:hypothetical protein